jgi:hypothetical protein
LLLRASDWRAVWLPVFVHEFADFGNAIPEPGGHPTLRGVGDPVATRIVSTTFSREYSPRFKLKLASLDLGDVEHGVDQTQKMLAVGADARERIHGFLGEFPVEAFLNQLGVTEDGGERGGLQQSPAHYDPDPRYRRCTAMYIASTLRVKPKHAKENVRKRATSRNNHMTPRIAAHTTATPITDT